MCSLHTKYGVKQMFETAQVTTCYFALFGLVSASSWQYT